MNAPPQQFGPVRGFTHVGFGTEQLPCLDHGALEGQILPGMQRVVMDENSNRTLLGKEMRHVIDRMAQAFPSFLN